MCGRSRRRPPAAAAAVPAARAQVLWSSSCVVLSWVLSLPSCCWCVAIYTQHVFAAGLFRPIGWQAGRLSCGRDFVWSVWLTQFMQFSHVQGILHWAGGAGLVHCQLLLMTRSNAFTTVGCGPSGPGMLVSALRLSDLVTCGHEVMVQAAAWWLGTCVMQLPPSGSSQ